MQNFDTPIVYIANALKKLQAWPNQLSTLLLQLQCKLTMHFLHFKADTNRYSKHYFTPNGIFNDKSSSIYVFLLTHADQ